MTTIFNEQVKIIDSDKDEIGVQNPFSIDCDTVYSKDIKTSLDNIGTFTGTISSLFENLDNSITDSSATNPKYFEFFLERPIKIGALALVAKTGSFKNVKILLKDRQGTTLATIDDSTNSTPYTSREYNISGAKNVCCIRVEFHTVDAITLSFIFIRKSKATTVEGISCVISEINSTDTILTAGSTFTGVAEDIKDQGVIQCAVYSDVDSATNGLVFQFSTDGTNWDHTDTYTLVGGTGKTYSLQPIARYFRIFYTNGASNQAAFRLQTTYKPVYVKPSSHRVGDLISSEDDAELVKSVLAAQKPGGDFTPIDATAGGNLKVSIEEFDASIETINVDRNTNLDGKAGLNVNAMGFGRVSDTIVKNIRLDASTESQIMMMYEHHEIHDGTHFGICDVQDLALNEVFDIQFTTPNTTTWSHIVYLLAVESETEFFIYETATIVTPGTPMSAINNNRNSANTSVNTIASILNTSVANANADTSVAAAIEILHGIVGSGKNSQGANERSRELVLKQNTTYCFRSIALAAGYISFCMNWYEHVSRN